MTGALVPVLTTHTARGLLLEGVPALRDPETGKLSFAPDVAAVLGALEVASKLSKQTARQAARAAARAAAVAERGHTITVQVLELLAQHDGLTARELRDKLFVTDARALNLLGYVVAASHAERAFREGGARSIQKIWKITDAGRAYLDQDRSTEAPG